MESFAQQTVDAVQKIDAVPTILDVICRTTGMGFAAVARVTEDRWIACNVKDDIAFGLEPGGELKIETTICNEIRQNCEPVIINKVSDDPVWSRHHTPALYGFESYISIPITLPDGRFFGTLCAIDPSPAKLDTPEIVGMFTLFADLVAFHLDANERVATSQANLSSERQVAELREQFIAVLGHDLRNPLGATMGGLDLLEKERPSAKSLRIIEMMRDAARRMGGLIENTLDLTRSRLGGGLGIARQRVDIQKLVTQVTNEFAFKSAGHVVDLRLDCAGTIDCDPGRVAQLLSNLVGNAISHGASDSPIVVACETRDDIFRLLVTNKGEEILPELKGLLFEPFRRGMADSRQEGLGLGLYIASEIAKAHGGTLSVTSSRQETCFTFEMPLGAAAAPVPAH